MFGVVNTKFFSIEGRMVSQGKVYEGSELARIVALDLHLPRADPDKYPGDKDGPYILNLYVGSDADLISKEKYGSLTSLASDFRDYAGVSAFLDEE